jgi:hypothetical protein
MAGRRNSKKGKPILLLKYLTVQNYNLLSARLHVAHWPLIRTAVNRGTGAGTEALIRRSELCRAIFVVSPRWW